MFRKIATHRGKLTEVDSKIPGKSILAEVKNELLIEIF
ncbi:hypothetical protein J2W47_000320 [Priestia megaterium]|nr:hypothetical protein [Priestia megaterium]